MQEFVRVGVNLPIQAGFFDYHVPLALAGVLLPGHLVTVPFGAQVVQGVIWRRIDQPEVRETKPIHQLLDPQPVLTAVQMRLAEWLEAETLAPLADCFDAMLPPGLSQQADTVFSLSQSLPAHAELSPLQRRLAEALERRGELRGRQIDVLFPRQDGRRIARGMTRRGWLNARPLLPPVSVRPRTARTVRLIVPVEEALAKAGKQGSPAYERRVALLRFLAQEKDFIESEWALAGSEAPATSTDLHRLEQLGLVEFSETESWRDPLERMEFVLSEPPRLTPDQNAVWEALRGRLQRDPGGGERQPVLLHGITGSGKTEIYLQAAAETLRQGYQVMVLVPEVSLTPQAVRRFSARFPGKVGLVHSRLSPGERYDTWRRARDGLLSIVVGARSALFSPLPKLGLIVIDEFHDDSYYQDDPDPAYHAVTAGLELARLSGAQIVLGSATPDVSLYERARREGWPLLRMPERVLAHRQTVANQLSRLGRLPTAPVGEGEVSLALPNVEIVDMRQELQMGNRTIFSRALQKALDETLQRGEQAILFLNRRGSATYVFCRSCGNSLDCPRCSIPLTWHADQNTLLCHTCGYRRNMPNTCPVCGSRQIRQFGLGTERVEKDVEERWPGARVMRWDADTVKRGDMADKMLSTFSAHGADILVGTQLVTKGLDLPLVTLAGVILADTGLQLPDYRSSERTFQLLMQLAGRAGRSPLGGRAIFQSYQPQHYAIQAAAQHDFSAFLRQELEYRQAMVYPPYSRLVRLELRLPDEGKVRIEAEEMAATLRGWMAESRRSDLHMIGPSPCFFARTNNLYRWQIILRGADPASLLRGRDLRGWRVQVDPLNLL